MFKPTVIICPGWTGPTPSGVPVRSKSPGSNFMIELTCSIKAGIGKIMSLVFPFCFKEPSSLSHMLTFDGSVISSLGRKSPIGRKVSNPLATLHGSPCFFAASYGWSNTKNESSINTILNMKRYTWIFLAVISIPRAYPAIWWKASAAFMSRPSSPITTPNSTVWY